AELLLKDEAAEERRAALVRITSSAHRMDRMVRSLVDYARTYFGGGVPIFPAPQKMDQICRRVIDEVEATHPDHPVALTVVGNVELTTDKGVTRFTTYWPRYPRAAS